MKPLSIFLGVSSALIMALSLTNFASAEIYKWTDAQGNTHYTQTPPQGQESTNNSIENIQSSIEAMAGKLISEPDNGSKLAGGGNSQFTGNENTPERQAFCNQQRSALELVTSTEGVGWQSGEGKYNLSPAELTAKINEFTNNIQEMCDIEELAAKSSVSTM